MIQEKVLQNWLVETIKRGELLNFISETEKLYEANLVDKDSSIIPQFSIDYLLKKKYSKSALRVLDSLRGEYDLVSKDTIQSISLDATERLFPDIILFNADTCQVIIIENKTNKKTEREALTELFGYSHEIRNHLPFLSNYDISYILISTDFNTLLDHSVSGQVLSEELNVLCLKPLIEKEQIISLNVHMPHSWSDIGQGDMPDDTLVSYTLFLHEKDDLRLQDFDFPTILNIASDLILQSANRLNSHGFLILWKNGLKITGNECVAGITIYVLNPFVFLPKAIERGFALNKESSFSKYLLNYIDDNGTLLFPASIFGIAKSAEDLLGNYFDLEWGRASNWVIDTVDLNFCLQRRINNWESWGAIGDYVRYFYLHPSDWFTDSEKKFARSYLHPYIGLQIINYLTGNTIFKYGYFSTKELFEFGKQIGRYRYACLNAMTLGESKSDSYEAFLFWNALHLSQSLKEVGRRLSEMPYTKEAISFPLAINKDNIYQDYSERIEKYLTWFINDFIDQKRNPTPAFIFLHAADCFYYFDHEFRGGLDKEGIKKIEKITSELIRNTIYTITLDRLKDVNQNKEILDLISTSYFQKRLYWIAENDIDGCLSQQTDAELSDGFEEVFLPILDKIKKGLLQELAPFKFPSSVDWSAMHQSAVKLFNKGERKTALLCMPDGGIGLGKIETPMTLHSKDEIIVHFHPHNTWQEMTVKEKWINILNGTSHFFNK